MQFGENPAAINVQGQGHNLSVESQIFSPFTIGGDMGGDIDISAQQLTVQGGAGISTASFTNAAGGNVNMDVSGLMQVDGFAPFLRAPLVLLVVLPLVPESQEMSTFPLGS